MTCTELFSTGKLRRDKSENEEKFAAYLQDTGMKSLVVRSNESACELIWILGFHLPGICLRNVSVITVNVTKVIISLGTGMQI